MFKYSVGIKTTLLESFRSKKIILQLYFGKTNYDDVVFARNDFLRLVRAPNESLILIIIYYTFKYITCSNTQLGSKQLCYSHFGAKKVF